MRHLFLNYIKPFTRRINDLLDYYNRCNDGHSDLKKGYPNACPISQKQKDEIEAFWKPYLNNWKSKRAFDIRWFDIYNRTNKFGANLATYIPDSFYYAIVDKCLTNALDANVLDDKNLYDLYFNDVNQPKTICRKIKGVYLDSDYTIITEEDAIQKCLDNGSVIVKPSINSLGGRGIEFWSKDEDVDSIKQIFSSCKNVVVQDLIKQHSFMASFTNSCVNTMRIVTLLWKNAVNVTTSVLIMGSPTAKTNHLHRGGYVCGILPDGHLRDVAFDGNLNEYVQHPNGIVFSKVKIPNYEKCVSLVKRLAPRMSGVAKLLSWDITLDEYGEPLLIEVNLTWGGSVQIAGGPVFGENTKDVLDYVLENRGVF